MLWYGAPAVSGRLECVADVLAWGRPMRVEVLSIGDEILCGEVLDTNAGYAIRCLRELDVTITARVTVGDDADLIAEVLRSARRRADVVLTWGGLGDGEDDATRAAVAAVTGRRRRPEPPGVEGATLLGDPTADANGFMLQDEAGTLICLPGAHRRMTYLLETEALPHLQERMAREGLLARLALRTAGVMESNIRQQLADLEMEPGQQVSYSSYAGQTDVLLTVEAGSEEAAQASLADLARRVRARLRDHVYGRGEDTLEKVVVEYVVQSGLTVCVAEHETGGALGRLLRPLPEAETKFVFPEPTSEKGVAAYLEILPPQSESDLTSWCRQAAESLRARAGVDVALLVYNHATQSGVQTLITLAAGSGVSMMQRSFGGHPGNIDQWGATLALVHLRRWLLAYHPEAAPRPR